MGEDTKQWISGWIAAIVIIAILAFGNVKCSNSNNATFVECIKANPGKVLECQKAVFNR